MLKKVLKKCKICNIKYIYIYIYIYIYNFKKNILWGPVSQEVLLKLYKLGLWPNPKILTNPRMAK